MEARSQMVMAVDPAAVLTSPSLPGGSILDREDLKQAPAMAAPPTEAVSAAVVPAGAVPVAAAVPAAVPVAAAAAVPAVPAVAVPAGAAPAAPAGVVPAVAAPPVAPAVAVVPTPALAPVPPATNAADAGATTVAPVAGNSTSTSQDSPPYLQGPIKIFVYGLFFAVLYLAVWAARLPPDRRPTAVDEGLMRWIESQEEEDATGAMNCMLVRVKTASGLPADKQPCAISVECSAFKKELAMGQTDFQDDSEWNTCFVGPLIDQDEKARTVTMAAAKPEVKFVVSHQADGEKPKDFAQAVVRPAADGASSSSAAAGGGGITRGEWCTVDLKLTASGSGATGVLKRMAGGSLGTLSVEVKAMNVNSSGKALLKSNYYCIALRKEFKKPYSACARTLATALMGMLALTSLPLIGDMFNGCFYLSCHGLTTAFTLFCMSIPHWAKLFHVHMPKWITSMSIDSLRTAGASLMSMGSTGVYTALWWGRGEDCTNHFWSLEVLLIVDSLLFSWAWWKGEGGGLMGLING